MCGSAEGGKQSFTKKLLTLRTSEGQTVDFHAALLVLWSIDALLSL